MKKPLLFLILPLSIWSQDLSHLRLIAQPEKSASEFVGSSIKDANNRICAAIKVISNLDGFSYESNNGVVKFVDKLGQDMVYLSPDEQVLEIFRSDYVPLKLYLAELGILLEERSVWNITIRGDEPNVLSIGIVTTPPGAEVFIDDKSLGHGEKHLVRKGEHVLTLKKPEYQTKTVTITVDEKNTFFRFTLQKLANASLTIDSEPPGAVVYLDTLHLGRTPVQSAYAPGRYHLRLSLERYQNHDEEVELQADKKLSRRIKLKKIMPSASLQVQVRPRNARLELRGPAGEFYTAEGDFVFSELSAGIYSLKAGCDGYADKEEMLALKDGEKLRHSVQLTRQQNDDFKSDQTTSTTAGTMTDIDGNVYKIVRIGNQWWMAENLRVTRFRNGDPLTAVAGPNDWRRQGNAAYCDYSNGSESFGKLYNWQAVIDRRNIAPAGWRVATMDDWLRLVSFLGGDRIAGGKLKEEGYDHWRNPNTGATNESGFIALPAGACSSDGGYFFQGEKAFFWASGPSAAVFVRYIVLYHNSSFIKSPMGSISEGCSIRCVRE